MTKDDFEGHMQELLKATPYKGVFPEEITPEEFIVDVLGMGVVVNQTLAVDSAS
jgi:hypothetical protein